MSSQIDLKIGVVGATGMVGQSFMSLLNNSHFQLKELRPFASQNSLGKTVECQNKTWPLQVLSENCFEGLDLVFFSSGDEISDEWAPRAVAAGAWAVDNSAAFRMHKEISLVVPEVNAHLLQSKKPQIIANPNCSTIQLVVVLKSLRDQFGLAEVRVASYQAVSGAGQAAHDELLTQARQYQSAQQNVATQNFPHPIAFNCIPQIGSFSENGFCSEELKIMRETKKILDLPQLKVSAFTVRVPVLNAHAEAVWVTLNAVIEKDELLQALQNSEGVVVLDSPKESIYPMQRDVSGKDPVYVGRIHRDLEDPKTWLMWVVSDNIRKGAALNGLQIAERIFDFKA